MKETVPPEMQSCWTEAPLSSWAGGGSSSRQQFATCAARNFKKLAMSLVSNAATAESAAASLWWASRRSRQEGVARARESAPPLTGHRSVSSPAPSRRKMWLRHTG